MRQAGQYPYRLLWLRCVRPVDGTTGDRPKTYSPHGYLWGSVELQSANHEVDYGAVRSVATGTVTLRNWPAIVATDRLFWPQFNYTLVLDGVRVDHANNETVLDVHVLIDGTIYTMGNGARLSGTVGL